MTTNQIPQRVYYSVSEAAQLAGVTREWLYAEIRKGNPDIKVKRRGAKITVHRSFIFGDDPTMLMVHPHTPTTVDDIDQAIGRWLERLAALAARREGRAA
jgi:hypothetical protein